MAGAAVEVAGVGTSRGAVRGQALAGLSRVLRFVVREPFFQFFALGALLFLVSEYLDYRANTPRIEITAAQVEGIRNNYRLQYGVPPTDEQLRSLVDQFIREEVYYREALRVKLDENDEIVRRRMVQKFEFLEQDLGAPPEPTDEFLEAYYRSHEKNYETPERLTFSQVFFSVDRMSDREARARAERVLATLERNLVARAPELGDAFPGPVDYAGVTPTQVRRAFGSSELSEEIFKVELGRWSQPLRSGLGWHLLYISLREPAHLADFASVRETVRRDFLEGLREERNAAAFERLKARYLIVRE
jgi:peptidyl-prolyl cis-trans isomerase C